MQNKLICSAALLGYIFLFPAIMFSEELSLQKIDNDITWNSEIRDALLLFEEGVEKRQVQKIDDSISQLTKIRERLHTENLSFVTELLLKKGEVLFKSGERELGIHLLEEVRVAFPSDYHPYLKLSRLYLSFSGFHPISGISRLFAGIKVYLSMKTRKEELGNLMIQVLLINLTLTGYIVVLVFFTRHFSEAAFDLARVFHLSRDTLLFKLTAICFFIIPLWAGGFLPLIVTLSFLLWPYLTNLKERCFILGFTLLLSGFTIFQARLPAPLLPDSMYTILKLENFSKNSWDRETLSVLEKLIEENEDSAWLNVAKGLIHKWNGEPDKSYAIFSRLYKKFPDDTDVLINMGNYSVTAGRLTEAKRFYKRALFVNPDIAEARYNLSITLDNLMEFDPAKEEFDKAYSLDSRQIQDFLDFSKGKVGLVLPMDKMPTGKPPTAMKAKPVEPSTLTPLEIFSGILKKENVPLVFALLVIYLSIFLGLRQKLILKPIEQCDECGTIFYSGSKCRICTALMLPHSRVEPAERKKVIENLGNYQFRKKISPLIFNLLAPGSGLILRNKLFTGVFTLLGHWMLFSLAALCFLGANAPIQTETAFFMFAAYYLSANTFLLRQR